MATRYESNKAIIISILRFDCVPDSGAIRRRASAMTENQNETEIEGGDMVLSDPIVVEFDGSDWE